VTDSAGDILDLTDYTATAQIRKTYTSSSLSATFTTSIAAVAGQVTISLTDTQTSALEAGRYVYDLNIESGTGVKTRVIEGQAVITPGVTR
jgi:hypothetical protein